MPLSGAIVRRIDPKRLHLETVAAWLATPDAPLPGGRSENRERVQRLLDWCDEREVVHLPDGESTLGDLPLLIPEGIEGTILAGPLHDPTGPRGVLILVAPKTESFDEPHLKMAQSLLEPFSAALSNDQRLREWLQCRPPPRPTTNRC